MRAQLRVFRQLVEVAAPRRLIVGGRSARHWQMPIRRATADHGLWPWADAILFCGTCCSIPLRLPAASTPGVSSAQCSASSRIRERP